MVELISIARVGRQWAVQHRGGYLGHARSLEEATSIGEELVSWLRSQGRAAELAVGGSIPASPASGADRPERG